MCVCVRALAQLVGEKSERAVCVCVCFRSCCRASCEASLTLVSKTSLNIFLLVSHQLHAGCSAEDGGTQPCMHTNRQTHTHTRLTGHRAHLLFDLPCEVRKGSMWCRKEGGRDGGGAAALSLRFSLILTHARTHAYSNKHTQLPSSSCCNIYVIVYPLMYKCQRLSASCSCSQPSHLLLLRPPSLPADILHILPHSLSLGE